MEFSEVIFWIIIVASLYSAVRSFYYDQYSRLSEGPDFEQAEIDAHNAHELELAKQAVLEHELGIWPHEEPGQVPVQRYTLGGPIKVHRVEECKACAAVRRGDVCLCDRCNPWVAKHGG